MNLLNIFYQIKRRIRVGFSIGLLLLVVPVALAESFVVQDIRVEGLQRIRLGTVLNYLPVRADELFDSASSGNVIRALYDTGFFQHVALARQGDTLIVRVVERATIGNVEFSGNKDISTKQLEEVFQQMQLVQGGVFQRSMLERLTQELKQEYNNRGKYNARITAVVTPLDQNRVAIKVDISEGKGAKIKAINVIGNKTFSDGELLDKFSLSTPTLLTFITGKDKYTAENLTASLESLQSFYMDRGFIRYNVDSSQVLLSPDLKDVYIDIKLTEGPRYTFSGYDFRGDLILPEENLNKLVQIKAGDYYSHQSVTQSIEFIGDSLSYRGYGFPLVSVEPIIDEDEQQVFITYVIDPGRKTYVRNIVFAGNVKTADYVLRRAMRQNEGALLSLGNVRESERQLRLLRYLENVSVETIPVPGTNNQVDLLFNVTELPSTEAIASLGYAISDGIIVNAALNQYNFMGSGSSLGFNFNTSLWGQSYSVNYYDPYHTMSGIGRGVKVYFQRFTPSGNLDIATFGTDRYGGAIDYNFLLSNTSSLQLGYGFEHLDISSTGGVAQIVNFVESNGRRFNQVRLTTGWNNNSFDRFPFPTRGLNQQILGLAALPVTKQSLTYYKVSYLARYYKPVIRGFIFTLLGSVGYGNTFNGQGLPFFENWYAGGIADPGQLRGFESYSLGPRDAVGNPLGGNLLVNGSAGLILPYPLSRNNLRLTAFVDAGNVYSKGLPLDQRGDIDPGPIRFAAGVSAEWRSPFGPLLFSLAVPLNEQKDNSDNPFGDRPELFQFTLSTGF